MSKYCRLDVDGHVLNIVDTPGHSDFGGEVERVLSMVDGEAWRDIQRYYIYQGDAERDVCVYVCDVDACENVFTFVCMYACLPRPRRGVIRRSQLDCPNGGCCPFRCGAGGGWNGGAHVPGKHLQSIEDQESSLLSPEIGLSPFVGRTTRVMLT
jgi:hypothetical protein